MAVLVTGASGFLGSALVERLIAHGQRDIRCLVRESSDLGKLESLQRRHPETNLRCVSGSLSDSREIFPLLSGVETIYHLAAGMKGSWADIVTNSVVASRNLLDAAAGARTPKIVLVSSFSVYGVSDLPRNAVVNEETPLETYPERRDPYSYGKLRQEMLFHQYQERCGFKLAILRPGVIYGPGAAALSARVGLRFPGFFLHAGGRNLLPLSYVTNCAEAVALAGMKWDGAKDIFNVHDDDLPTCRSYLRAYRRNVERLPSLPMPRVGLWAMARAIEWYHHFSKGQLPAFLTPYKAAALWSGNRFDNRKLKALGWKQLVPTAEGMRRTFEYQKAQIAP